MMPFLYRYSFLFIILIMSVQKDFAVPKSIFLKDSDSIVKVNKIVISGNTKTKEKIIRREITFKEGQYYTIGDLEKELEQTYQQLIKLPLFNYVTIEKEFNELTGLVTIYIIVEERWFLWPEILIINNERNLNKWWETKDFSKLDYRFSVLQYNVFGLNHKMRLGLSFGYTKEFYLQYQNIFLDKRQKHSLNILTKVFYRDKEFFRTYENKRETYQSANAYAIEGSEFGIGYNFRPRFYGTHSFYLGYLSQTAEDSLIQLNNDFFGHGNKSLSFLKFEYNFTYDRRNSREYPTLGFILYSKILHQGFGLLDNKSYYDFSVYLRYKQFYHIGGKFYGAHSISLKKSITAYEAYYFKKGLGYKDYLRGYEYYVIDGQDFALLKSNLKYNLLPKKVVNVHFLPLKKFQKIHFSIYLNAYFDIGYVYDKYQNDAYRNTLSNQLLFSGGLGVDLVTYYDKIIRFEYSIIRSGEHGFFIHFFAPI